MSVKNKKGVFSLSINVFNENCEKPSMEVTLHNNSGFEISDFTLCFTVITELVMDTLSNCIFIFKEGSYNEIAPKGLQDNILRDGESWTFSMQIDTNRRLQITDVMSGVFLKSKDRNIIIDSENHTIHFDNHVNVKEATIPHYPTSQNYIPIVPAPNTVEFGDEQSCSLYRGFNVRVASDLQCAWDTAVESGVALWKSYNPLFFSAAGTPLSIIKNDTYPSEGYKLHLKSDEVLIEASTHTGCYYALLSLTQMCRGYKTHKTVTIIDEPFFEYRGQHLDVVRQFYSVDEVKRFIDTCAFHKINVLHWHITDDEGWRIEIKSLPQLTEKLSHRGIDELVPPAFGSHYESYGGYYTQEQVNDIVNYASNRGVDVIPEIDVPGHCFGLLRAVETLIEKTDKSQYISIQNYSLNTLNPAMDETYKILDMVIKEVAELFPSPYLHIGADERPSGAWLGSEECSALMKQENLKDGNAIQTYFVKKVHNIVRKYGKIMGAWEEATEDGDVDSDLYVVSWRTSDPGIKAAAKGHHVIMSPSEYLYFDMAQSMHPLEPGLTYAGYSDLVKTYNYDPLHCSEELDITDEVRSKIKGIQGCLWSETLHRKQRVEFMMFPRLCAMAEVAWTRPENKNQDQFLYNVKHTLLPFFERGNVGYRPLDYISNYDQYRGRI